MVIYIGTIMWSTFRFAPNAMGTPCSVWQVSEHVGFNFAGTGADWHWSDSWLNSLLLLIPSFILILAFSSDFLTNSCILIAPRPSLRRLSMLHIIYIRPYGHWRRTLI